MTNGYLKVGEGISKEFDTVLELAIEALRPIADPTED
jgi:hypothetical protein